MATQNRTTLKSYFETGDKPTQSQFADLIDSMALVDEVQGGSLPQTEHFHYVGNSITTDQNEQLEIIGVVAKPEPNAQTLAVGIVKSITENKEFAVLGGYTNGLRVERNNIQNDGSAEIKMYATGLTDAANVGDSAQQIALLVQSGLTGEINRLTMEQFAMFVDFYANLKQNLKSVSVADINNASNTSQIVIPLDMYSLPATRYIKQLFVQTNAFDNVSAIQQAFITLPGSTTTIDVLPYLSASKYMVIPITHVQELQANATQLTLTLIFDAGNGEVNPQNFTQGGINIQAMISQNYNN